MKRSYPFVELAIALAFCLGTLTFAEFSKWGLRTEERYRIRDVHTASAKTHKRENATPPVSYRDYKAEWERQHNQPRLGTLFYRDAGLNFLVGLVLAGPIILSYRAFAGRRNGKMATGEKLWMIQGILGYFLVVDFIISESQLFDVQGQTLARFLLGLGSIVAACFQLVVIGATFVGILMMLRDRRNAATGVSLTGFIVSFGATIGAAGYLVLWES